MNKFLSILLLCLFAFTGKLAAQKRTASDACPGMNNKKPTGQYASLSKRSGQNSSFSSPKYQYLYSKSRTAVTASALKKEKQDRNENRPAGREKEPEFVPVNEKNSSSKSMREEGKSEKKTSKEPADEFVTANTAATPAEKETAPSDGVIPSGISTTSGPGSEKITGSNETKPPAPAEKTKKEEKPVPAKQSADKTGYTKYTNDRSSYTKAPGENKKSKKKKKACFGKKGTDSCPEF